MSSLLVSFTTILFIYGGNKEGETKDNVSSNQRGVVGSRNLNMSDNHRAGLQQLKDRDAKIVSRRKSWLKLRAPTAIEFVCVIR